MRKLLLFAILSLAALSAGARPPPSAGASPKGKPPAGKAESDYERRIRTEGAAGGTAPVPERERQGVGAGAKPHMHFDQIGRGLRRRSDDAVIAPAK